MLIAVISWLLDTFLPETRVIDKAVFAVSGLNEIADGWGVGRRRQRCDLH